MALASPAAANPSNLLRGPLQLPQLGHRQALSSSQALPSGGLVVGQRQGSALHSSPHLHQVPPTLQLYSYEQRRRAASLPANQPAAVNPCNGTPADGEIRRIQGLATAGVNGPFPPGNFAELEPATTAECSIPPWMTADTGPVPETATGPRHSRAEPPTKQNALPLALSAAATTNPLERAASPAAAQAR